MDKTMHIKLSFKPGDVLTTDFELIKKHTGIKNGTEVMRHLITEKARKLK